MACLLGHPELPTCEDCKRWLYDPGTWKQSTRGGEPLARPPGASPPCWKCPKSLDKKTPNPDADLSYRSWLAYQQYLRIKAGMPMPADLLVAWYCGLIQFAIDCVDRRQQQAGVHLLTMVSTIGMIGAKGKRT